MIFLEGFGVRQESGVNPGCNRSLTFCGDFVHNYATVRIVRCIQKWRKCTTYTPLKALKDTMSRTAKTILNDALCLKSVSYIGLFDLPYRLKCHSSGEYHYKGGC